MVSYRWHSECVYLNFTGTDAPASALGPGMTISSLSIAAGDPITWLEPLSVSSSFTITDRNFDIGNASTPLDFTASFVSLFGSSSMNVVGDVTVSSISLAGPSSLSMDGTHNVSSQLTLNSSDESMTVAGSMTVNALPTGLS